MLERTAVAGTALVLIVGWLWRRSRMPAESAAWRGVL